MKKGYVDRLLANDGYNSVVRTARKVDNVVLENNRLLKEFAEHLKHNNELFAQNNKLLESINDYLRKISVNTSSMR